MTQSYLLKQMPLFSVSSNSREANNDQRKAKTAAVTPSVSLTAFPINVGVKLSLKHPLFDLIGLLVVGNVLEGVGLRTQRSIVTFSISIHKHGAHQLPFTAAHAEIKL